MPHDERWISNGVFLGGDNGMTSGMHFAPLQRADIPELSQFLTNGFGLPGCALWTREVLTWKYFDGPGGPSEGTTRSLVARSAGKIVGHVGMCQRQLIVLGDGAPPVSTMHAVDWMGSPAHPTTGALLMLQAFARSKTQFALPPHSPEVLAFLKRLGFEQKTTLLAFRKVLLPSHRLRATGE
jgi:hypothetical protein